VLVASLKAPRLETERAPDADLARALASCATESDIVQVLYSSLHRAFGYEVVLLQVLEREGWYHAVAVDQGVLQDVRRNQLAPSNWAAMYEAGRPTVIAPQAALDESGLGRSRGPGTAKVPEIIIWMPVIHRDQVIGAVLYQSSSRREVPSSELDFLQGVHNQLGVLVSNAYLNEITRNQAVRLSALNSIARALSSTLDESGVIAALHSTMTQLLPVDVLELVVQDDRKAHMRVLSHRAEGTSSRSVALRSKQLSEARQVLETGRAVLSANVEGAQPRSAAWVPIREGGHVRGVLSIQTGQPDAYEQSTLTFLEPVADEVALALRNAWSYEAIEAQRRRLEVVNAVGQRLAASLDRWSIMRTLREELARHLSFDVFTLAAILARPDGPLAEGYAYDSRVAHPLPLVPLSAAGSSIPQTLVQRRVESQ